MKCNINFNICDKFCPNKRTKGADNHLLLGFASNNDKILFNKHNENNYDIEYEITENIGRIFDLQVKQTLASALDLLPDFLSIPIGEDQSNTTNIDECLQILKNIDVNSFINKNKSNVINKISEMRQIIERLQIQIMGDDEGHIESNIGTDINNNIESEYIYEYEYEYEYEYSDDDDASLIGIHEINNITLMGGYNV